LRLFSEGLTRGDGWVVIGVARDSEVSRFHLGLQLARAFERDERVARAFADVCFQLGLFEAGHRVWEPKVPQDKRAVEGVDQRLLALLIELAPHVPGGLGFFASAPKAYVEGASNVEG
jgi:hypothetical protein